MRNIENEYHSRFNNEKLSNDDFDTEALWNDIDKNLKATPAKTNSSLKTWSLGSLALLSVIGVLFFCYNNSNSSTELAVTMEDSATTLTQDVATENNLTSTTENSMASGNNINVNQEEASSNNKQEKRNRKTPNTNSNKSNYKTPSKTTKPSVSKNNKQTPIALNSSDTNIDSADPNITSDSKTDVQESITEEALAYSSVSIQNPINNKTRNNNQTRNNESTSKEHLSGITKASSADRESVSSDIWTTPGLPTLKTKLNTAKKEFTTAVVNPTLINQTPDPPSEKKNSINVIAFAGMNYLRLDHQHVDLGPGALNHTTYSGSPSSSFGVQAEVSLKDRFLINAGVEYHNLWTVFLHSVSSSDLLLFQDYERVIVFNSLTGDTINSFTQPAFVQVSSERKIVHHNNVKRVSIPLQVGIQGGFKKFKYGCKAGISFNINSGQKGRSYDAFGDIQFVDDMPALQSFNKTDIAFRLSPFLDYKLTERLAIRLEPQWSYSKKTPKLANDLRASANLYNLNFGLKIDL